MTAARVAALALAALLTGCRMPTEPTPNAVREAMRPDTLRLVTEVDALTKTFASPVGGKCDSGWSLVRVRGAWVRGTTVVSDTFLVTKCGVGI